MISLKNQAIQTALVGDWISAVTLNEELLKADPNDIETLNRLGYAYSVIGKTKDARITYQKVLAIDSQNPIAIRNLKRLKGDNNKHSSYQSSALNRTNTIFIEETGKTKVIELINVATPSTISHLITGELLTLSVKRLKIFVLDTQKTYIGVLPDNIGKRLIRFIDGGNTYEAYIKSVDKNHVVIFIRESKRALRFKSQPSFIINEKQLVFDKNQAKNVKQKNSKKESEDENYEDESL